VGLAGCSIEDSTRTRPGEPIYPLAEAVERVTAAVEAARSGPGIVLTARAENHLWGRGDLADTIARLQAYQEAGADVLYAPGITAADDLRAVITSVDRPVNVLLLPGTPTVGELADLGAARISVGSELSYVALAAVGDAARQLLDGKVDYWDRVAAGARLAAEAFPPLS
jgi:2-methylisocitrate lyase-like PEP mutase family enzyme